MTSCSTKPTDVSMTTDKAFGHLQKQILLLSQEIKAVVAEEVLVTVHTCGIQQALLDSWVLM